VHAALEKKGLGFIGAGIPFELPEKKNVGMSKGLKELAYSMATRESFSIQVGPLFSLPCA
jgi:hypothetical protein